MIDDKRKVIFVSIPRTGGHTITALFDKTENINPTVLGGRHARPHRYITIFPEKWEEYFTFTFVRNPFDRVVSAWSRLQRAELVKFDIEKNFDDIKELFTDFVIKRLPSCYNKMHYKPQVIWFDFLKAKKYDYVGRFEKFDKELEVIFDKINYYPNKQITKTFNSKRNVDYRDYYIEESKKIVEVLYKQDLERFKYIF